MDEKVIFHLSLALLCFLTLLLPLVLFLVVWLRKIQKRVDSVSNGWNVLCKLAPSEEPLTQLTEFQHETPNAFSNSIVIFNQQAEGSDENNAWKDIPRGFAYALVYDDEDGPRPDEEQSACPSQGDVKETDEESKSQEEIIPDASIPVASYLQIVDDNPAFVGVSSSERPATDAQQDKRRIYVSVGSADHLNPFADHDERQVDKNAEIEIGTQNGNDIPKNSEATETGKLECVVLIENTKQTNEASSELRNVTSPQGEDIQKETRTQGGLKEDTEKSNEKVLNKEGPTDTSENCCKAPTKSQEGIVEVRPPKSEISENGIASETWPKPKPRLSKKMCRGVNAEGKEKTFNPSPHINNPTEVEFHCDGPGQEADRKNMPAVLDECDLQQLTQQHTAAPPKTGVKSKKKTNEGNNAQVANDAGYSDNKSDANDGSIPNYELVGIVDSDNGGKKMSPSANTQEMTQNNESTGVISQLRGLLRNRTSETPNRDKRANTAVRHSYPAGKQENNINENYKGKGKKAQRMSFPHNSEDPSGHERGVVKQDRIVFNVAQEKTGALSKSNQNCNKLSLNEDDTSEYELVVTSVSVEKEKPNDKENGQLLDECASTQEVREKDDSSDIISQLRSILHKGNAATAGCPDPKQEKKAVGKNEEHKRQATTASKNNEEVYSNLDEEGNEIYSEIPFSASDTKARTTSNDNEEVHNLSENEPFYVNLPFQQRLMNYSGGPALRPDEHEPPIYLNSDIIDI